MSSTSEVDDALAFLRDLPRLHRRNRRWRLQSLHRAERAVQLIGIFLLGLIVTTCLPPTFGGPQLGPQFVAALSAALAALQAGRLRRFADRPTSLLVLQAFASGAAGGVVLLVSGLAWRADIAWSVGETIAAGALLAALHAVAGEAVTLLRAEGRLAVHIALLGTGPTAASLRAQLEATSAGLIKVVGCYVPGQDDPPAGQVAHRGTLRTLLSDCRLEFVDAIVLALEPSDRDALTALRRSLRTCIQDIYAAPASIPLLETEAGDAPSVALGGATLRLIGRRPISGAAGFVKRALDVVGALMLIIFMAPLLAIISAAIKLDSRGPILFRQLRVGFNNRLFYILKFRSMYDDAADRLAKQQTVHGDSRITRVGRIIRRLSLDELPQLLNVLRGEMSLVGPRPHAPGTSIGGRRVHTLLDEYARRHLVHPGITGLAQVRGLRGGLHEFRQVAGRVAADLEYIERWSLWLDLRILLGTVLRELRNCRGI